MIFWWFQDHQDPTNFWRSYANLVNFSQSPWECSECEHGVDVCGEIFSNIHSIVARSALNVRSDILTPSNIRLRYHCDQLEDNASGCMDPTESTTWAASDLCGLRIGDLECSSRKMLCRMIAMKCCNPLEHPTMSVGALNNEVWCHLGMSAPTGIPRKVQGA